MASPYSIMGADFTWIPCKSVVLMCFPPFLFVVLSQGMLSGEVCVVFNPIVPISRATLQPSEIQFKTVSLIFLSKPVEII